MLTNDDLGFVVARIPKDLRQLMMERSLFIGGGFIREVIAGGDIQDIDVFGEAADLFWAADQLVRLRPTTRRHDSRNAITLLDPPRIPTQLITRWEFKTVEETARSFDFTVCSAVIGYDRKNSHFVSATHENFYPDLAARRLVYTFPDRHEDAGGSILRVRKFLARGYNIQAPSFAGVIARLTEYGTSELHQRAVAKKLSAKLREVDPLILIDGVSLVDEHEVIS